MARYIDADKLIEALQADYDREGAKADEMAMIGNADISVKYSHGQFCYLNAIERVKDTPAADIVPKSEVIDEFAERLKKYYDSLKGQAPSTAIIVYHIDQIAKEMKEKNNGNEN